MKLINNIWVQGIIAIIITVLLYLFIGKIHPFLDKYFNGLFYHIGAIIGYLLIPISCYFIISWVLKIFNNRKNKS